jgi:hypothetical protein
MPFSPGNLCGGRTAITRDRGKSTSRLPFCRLKINMNFPETVGRPCYNYVEYMVNINENKNKLHYLADDDYLDAINNWLYRNKKMRK